VIGEEFPEPKIPVQTLVDVLEGAIIKRRAQGRDHGVALLSEGLAEKLDLATLGPVEQDSYGNVRLSELDLGRVLKERVAASLKARGLDVTIVAKDLGYELRCAPPGGYDTQYCRSLGFWATRFLLEGGTGAMVTIQGGRLVTLPFAEMLDRRTGRIQVRYVDIHAESYRTHLAYMIRLKPEDLGPDRLPALAKAGNLSEQEFRKRFGPLLERRTRPR
jgi:6-phosphofructokinase 1